MPKKILAVDDEDGILLVVKVSLEAEGYEVITASDGREALERVALEKPDLVVMDVMMPEMDGFTALRHLKENEETAEIPVIMLTARDEESAVLGGWLRGADFYMIKPFDPMELAANVNYIFQDLAEAELGLFPSDV